MTFQKGESGNLAGKPKGTKCKTTISRDRQHSAVRVLEGLMLDTSVEPAVRLQSAVAILFNQTV